MINWLKTTTLRQFILLILLTAGTSLFPIFLDIHPRVNMSSQMAVLGILGAVLCVAVILVLKTLLLMLAGPRCQYELAQEIERQKAQSFYQVLGSSIVSGAGEELFFRTAVFAWLLTFAAWFAFFTHALLIFALNIRKNTRIFLPLIFCCEGTIFAAMYFYNKSYFMICISHFLTSLFWATTLKSGVAETATETVLSYRAQLLRRFRSDTDESE
jgi:hypothetical protein